MCLLLCAHWLCHSISSVCPQMCPLPAVTMPQCGPKPNLYLCGSATCGQLEEMTESPDSGHREMSPDSLSCTPGEWLLPCQLSVCEKTCSCGQPGRCVMQNSTSRGQCKCAPNGLMVMRHVYSGDSKATACNSDKQTDYFKGCDTQETKDNEIPLLPPPKVNPSMSSTITGLQSDHTNCGVKPAVSIDMMCPTKTGLAVTKPPSRNLFLQVRSLYKDICKKKSTSHPCQNSDAISPQNPETLQRCKDTDKAKIYYRKSPQNADVNTSFHTSVPFETKRSLKTIAADLTRENGVSAGAVGDMSEEPDGGAGKSSTEDTTPLLPPTLDSMTHDELSLFHK